MFRCPLRRLFRRGARLFVSSPTLGRRRPCTILRSQTRATHPIPRRRIHIPRLSTGAGSGAWPWSDCLFTPAASTKKTAPAISTKSATYFAQSASRSRKILILYNCSARCRFRSVWALCALLAAASLRGVFVSAASVCAPVLSRSLLRPRPFRLLAPSAGLRHRQGAAAARLVLLAPPMGGGGGRGRGMF